MLQHHMRGVLRIQLLLQQQLLLLLHLQLLLRQLLQQLELMRLQHQLLLQQHRLLRLLMLLLMLRMLRMLLLLLLLLLLGHVGGCCCSCAWAGLGCRAWCWRSWRRWRQRCDAWRWRSCRWRWWRLRRRRRLRQRLLLRCRQRLLRLRQLLLRLPQLDLAPRVRPLAVLPVLPEAPLQLVVVARPQLASCQCPPGALLVAAATHARLPNHGYHRRVGLARAVRLARAGAQIATVIGFWGPTELRIWLIGVDLIKQLN